MSAQRAPIIDQPPLLFAKGCARLPDLRRRATGPPVGDDVFIPQGGGDVALDHRCPGEDVVLSILTELSTRLAALDCTGPEQDRTIPVGRIPTRPRDGSVIECAGSGGRRRHQDP
ncbi:hypothetical protein [Nocardiopsis baichengensis]|uniref:hypothetical protein n=1 Tax=Nocardiopsis baichengensis TaxID=280240 RepID=UPI00034A6295|nr:hypothetical protein [Nocardiopsis baichengensis]